MQPLKKQLKLDSRSYYITHMNILNALLPIKMTPAEIEIIAAFLEINGTLADNRFSTTGRQIVRDSLRISHQYLTNYIQSLMKKGFIVKKNDKLQLIPILFPESESQEYSITIINDKTIQRLL